jgi:hypothetical protein
LPENRRKAMASDLQVAIARFVQDNYADSNAFGDLISPRAPSVVSSRIMQARLNIFGHIHGGHGQMTANGTQFVNASVVDEAYRLVHEPQVVEIDVSSEIA